MPIKRQLTESEKTEILRRYGRKCYATGHEIPEQETVHFDHIHAFALGGLSELQNIAPMCPTHNKQKGTLSLEDFRVKLELESFFKSGNKLTLKDLLMFLKENGKLEKFGEYCSIKKEENQIKIESAHGIFSTHLLHCPITKWEYFYLPIPVELIDSDDDEEHQFGLQPRYLILDKVFELFRHFQNHPVLQPSIGRIANGKIVLFDGQHKAAALLWAGKRHIEAKIYLNPDLGILNQTNISAHDKFAQTRFYSSVMVSKLGEQFGKDFENYKNREDQHPKTESGFLRYLEQTETGNSRAERNKRFRSYLYNAILKSPENLSSKLLSDGNRSSSETPLTLDMLSKSFFCNFLNTDPVEDDLTAPGYKRENEINNNIKLMNIFFELSLYNWKPNENKTNPEQLKLQRIYSSKSVMAWTEILKDTICATLKITDNEDRACPFYREISDTAWREIKDIAERLLKWKRWGSPPNSDIDSQLANNKTTLKKWLKDNGLTTGYLLGAME